MTLHPRPSCAMAAPGPVAKLADARDLKSLGPPKRAVRVRLPPGPSAFARPSGPSYGGPKSAEALAKADLTES